MDFQNCPFANSIRLSKIKVCFPENVLFKLTKQKKVVLAEGKDLYILQAKTN